MAAPESSPSGPRPRPSALSRPGPVLKQAGPARRMPAAVRLVLAPPPAAPEPSPPTVSADEPDYRALFREEAEDLLGEIDHALARWPDSDALEHIARGFHTLRGSARTIGLEDVGAAAGDLEESVRAVIDGKRPFSPGEHATVRRGCVDLARMIGWEFMPSTPELKEEPSVPGEPTALLDGWIADLEAWIGGDAAAAGRIRGALEAFRTAPGPGVPDSLGRSFGLLLEFLLEWGEAPPPAPMQAVLRRCLGDARDYLASDPGRRSPWRRRWGLYFNSLRVALAVERTAPDAASGPGSDPEMVRAFVEEARGLFDAVEQALMRWEKGEDVPVCRAELRRHFHTLKGAANSVGLRRLGSSYHDWEERMDRSDSAAPPADLLPFNDRVRRYLAELEENPSAEWRDAAAKAPPAPTTQVDPDLLEAFLEEARQLLDPIESALMAWERGEDPVARQAELRRHFHTLKGAANSIGLKELGADFHVLEERMQEETDEAARARRIPLVIACMDDTRRHLAALAADPAAPWSGGWEARFSGQAPVPHAPATTAVEKPAVRVEADRIRQLLDQSGEIVSALSRAESHVRDLDAVRRTLDDLRESLVRDAESARSGDPPGPAAVMEHEKTCAAVAARLSQLRRGWGGTQDEVLRRSRQLQKDLAGLNMGPVSQLFRRLQRVFRDALQEEGKQAALHTEGGQTRLDRTILERLYGPLLHIVRNAVAHGIEGPAVRESRGKSASGTVRISALPFSDHVRIEVADDGAGIDAEAVRRRAVQRGLIPEDAPPLSEEEVIRILFMPGFSTKETVSSVAGRGVGLDVVKEEIESMNGTVAVRFTPGAGAVWTIRVPLNLSAAEALIVRAGEVRAALPLAYIVRCQRLAEGDFVCRQGRLTLASSGLPYFALHEVLGSSAGEDPTHGIEVDVGAGRAVLGVHAILTRREVVSLDPGPLLRRLPVLSGVAPDADGTLLPVLQIPQMLRRLDGPERSAVVTPVVRPKRVLVVDDSASVRLAHRILLENLGWTVRLASGAGEALDLARGEPFDLVLSDLEMPGMDGAALLRALRAEPATAEVPFVMVTSRRESATQTRIREEGALACLSKPLDVTALLAAVSPLEPRTAND